jgi:hypothetical protein
VIRAMIPEELLGCSEPERICVSGRFWWWCRLRRKTLWVLLLMPHRSKWDSTSDEGALGRGIPLGLNSLKKGGHLSAAEILWISGRWWCVLGERFCSMRASNSFGVRREVEGELREPPTMRWSRTPRSEEVFQTPILWALGLTKQPRQTLWDGLCFGT